MTDERVADLVRPAHDAREGGVCAGEALAAMPWPEQMRAIAYRSLVAGLRS